MPRKTSKTDQVLDMITGNEEATPAKRTRRKKADVTEAADRAEERKGLSKLINDKLTDATSKRKSKKSATDKESDNPDMPQAMKAVSLNKASDRTGFQYLNVMEMIVKNEIDANFENLDVCHCQRCQMDVIALALSNLPPKYVVTEQATSPLLNYYSSKFHEIVNIEIMKACTLVKSYPHHGRS